MNVAAVVLGVIPLASARATSAHRFLLHQHVAEVYDGDGPWIDSDHLADVHTIDCLRQKERSLDADCETQNATLAGTRAAVGADGQRGWQIGSYPHYNSSICGQVPNATADADQGHNDAGDAQPFCDPDGLLRVDQRKQVEQALFDFWVNTKVQCGIPGTGMNHSRPFRLGVALAKTLPLPEQDDESLALFGDYILSAWDMQGTGEEMRHEGLVTMCADTALLVFVEEPYRAMVLASPNCDFLCMQRGGQRIQTAANIGWETSLEEAILHAIAAVPGALTPWSVDRSSTSADTARHLRDLDYNTDSFWWYTQDALLGVVIVLWLGCLVWMAAWFASGYVARLWWDFRKVFLPGYIDDSLRRGDRAPFLQF